MILSLRVGVCLHLLSWGLLVELWVFVVGEWLGYCDWYSVSGWVVIVAFGCFCLSWVFVVLRGFCEAYASSVWLLGWWIRSMCLLGSWRSGLIVV